MNWIGFDKATGKIRCRGVGPSLPVDTDTMGYMTFQHKNETHVVNGVPIYTPDPDLQWEKVRKRRDDLLAKTDWTQLPDVNAELAAAFVTYRQTLRDLPQNTEYPFNVTWPEPPVSLSAPLQSQLSELAAQKVTTAKITQ